MKLLLILYSGPTPSPIEALLEAHDGIGYTELANAHGAGVTGRVAGTRAWPGTASVLLTAVPDERVAAIEEALRAYRDAAPPGERLHVATLPVERFL
jgi:hypothetical protein